MWLAHWPPHHQAVQIMPFPLILRLHPHQHLLVPPMEVMEMVRWQVLLDHLNPPAMAKMGDLGAA